MGERADWKFGITGRFISVISVVTLAILAAIAFGCIKLTGGFLSLQADTFIGQLRQEQAREEQILRDGLQAKGKLLTDMLVDSSTELLLTSDFESLAPLAASAEKDPDIDSVVFFDENGNELNQGAEKGGGQVLERNIEFNNETLGRIEIVLNFDSVDRAVAGLKGRIGALVEETGRARAEAGRIVLSRITLFAAAGLIAVCLVAYLLFSRIIVKPLRRDMDLARAISEGDLTRRLNMGRNDELGELADALDEMADGLSEKATLAEVIAGDDLTAVVPLASDLNNFRLSKDELNDLLRAY